AGRPGGAPGEGGDDQAVRAAGLVADGRAVVEFFRDRARDATDRKLLAPLIRQLGDPSAAVRDRAAAALVSRGAVAIPLLRRAVNDLEDAEVAGRARRCLAFIEGPSAAALPASAARLLALRKRS